MKLYNTPDNRRIEMTRDEYVKTCREYNRLHWYDQIKSYDMVEITYLETDVSVIVTENTLDEYDEGFIMFSDHFYDLMMEHTQYPLIHDEDPVEVRI